MTKPKINLGELEEEISVKTYEVITGAISENDFINDILSIFSNFRSKKLEEIEKVLDYIDDDIHFYHITTKERKSAKEIKSDIKKILGAEE